MKSLRSTPRVKDRGSQIGNPDAERQQEERIARKLGGLRVPGSGALGAPGDVRTDLLLVECKRTEQESLRLEQAWLEKIDREAMAESRSPALAIELALMPPGQRDWLLLPRRVFEALVDIALHIVGRLCSDKGLVGLHKEILPQAPAIDSDTHTTAVEIEFCGATKPTDGIWVLAPLARYSSELLSHS